MWRILTRCGSPPCCFDTPTVPAPPAPPLSMYVENRLLHKHYYISNAPTNFCFLSHTNQVQMVVFHNRRAQLTGSLTGWLPGGEGGGLPGRRHLKESLNPPERRAWKTFLEKPAQEDKSRDSGNVSVQPDPVTTFHFWPRLNDPRTARNRCQAKWIILLMDQTFCECLAVAVSSGAVYYQQFKAWPGRFFKTF